MTRTLLLATAAIAAGAPPAAEAVVVPSVYNNSIFAYYPPDGDIENDPNIGTAFDDWDSVPVAFEDSEDNSGFVDFKTVKLANDENYLYVYIEYFGESSTGTNLSFDTDQDVATGFDIFDFGLVGSEATWVNDFDFAQRSGFYNEGSLYGGPYAGGGGEGGAPIFPFWNVEGDQREWQIPLDVTFDAAGAEPVFTQDTFNLLIWNESGQGDILGDAPEFDVLTYTLAQAPVVEGDYTGDGLVDAADYTVWRDSENDIGADLPADGNGDQVVDGADYTLWANNYGGGAAAPALGVPEPGAVVLAGIALAALGRRRARGSLPS